MLRCVTIPNSARSPVMRVCHLAIFGFVITFFVACAVSPKDHKVAVCHKGKTLYVDEAAREAHIRHGDYGRACYGEHRDEDDKKGKKEK